jgi:hypothetical protein
MRHVGKLTENLQEAAVLREIAAELRQEAAELVAQTHTLCMSIVDIWETTRLRVPARGSTLRTE